MFYYAQDPEFVYCRFSYPNKPHYEVVTSRELTENPTGFVMTLLEAHICFYCPVSDIGELINVFINLI